MNQDQKIVAYFDFDGTITTCDTLLPFLVFVVGRLRFMLLLPRLLPILLHYWCRVINNESAKQKTLMVVLRNYSKNYLNEKSRQFALTKLNHYVKPAVYAKLEWHREHGNKLILVSANLAIYLRHWAKFHKLDDVVATELEFDANNHCSGRLLTRNCYAEQKVVRIQQYLRQNKQQFDYSYGYGNSRGDYEMLEYVNEPYYISGELIEKWDGR